MVLRAVGEEVLDCPTTKSISPMPSNANFRKPVPSPSQPAGERVVKREIALLRIEKLEQLRVRQKNIHIMAFAMIDLQHHRGAAAERPMVNDSLFRIDLPDERTRYSEQPRPIRLWDQGTHAASG